MDINNICINNIKKLCKTNHIFPYLYIKVIKFTETIRQNILDEAATFEQNYTTKQQVGSSILDGAYILLISLSHILKDRI